MDSPNSSISYSQEETTSQFCTPRPTANQNGLSVASQVDDVLHLTDVNLDTFLRNLQIRFFQGLYYTYIGDVCVSVNPNRTDLSIYGRDFIRLYYEAKQVHKLPPHIFAIAASAFRQTFETNHDSVVIITGESGSGKTEASKHLLLFITHVVQMTQQLCPSAGMVKQIAHTESLLLKSNCILEAFGCAQTLRNVNSSRFAKYIEIYLKHRGKLASNFSRYEKPGEPNFFALIHSYMLEKSRIITRQKGERNFHVFYQLLASLDDTSKCQLGLTDDAAEYKYLDDSTLTNHDGEIFKKVLEAMDMVGFTCHEKQTIFQMLAAILHLGNLQMESAQVSRRHPDGLHGMVSVRVKATSALPLEHFCRLLSIDIEDVVVTLCSRQIWVRGETLLKPYSLVESLNGRNALAKALYERTFNFIVSLINRSLLVSKSPLSDKPKVNTIGLLDIYGFEVSSSQANLFEQFLVNYCNEKLHQVFLDVILKKEQKLYHHEDINWQMVEYKDNLPICLLLDEPHRGIFPLIDEACTSGQDNSDELLLEEFNKRFAKSAYFASRSLNPSFRHLRHQKDFLVRHYAGDVIYSIKGFTRKNMDPLHADYKRLMHSSANALIREMWPDGKPNDDALPNRPPISTAMEYRKSMSQLISCLTKKRQFFICCIKPNEEPNEESVYKFHDDKVRHQIQYLGLVENARVRKAGFFHRYFYQGFLQRYRMLYRGHLSKEATQLGQTPPDNQTDGRPIFRPACEQIIADYWTGSVEKRVAFGKSMIFFREMAIIDCLEQKRDQCLERIIFRLQTYSRAFLGKRSFARLKAASLVLKLYTRYMKCKFLGGVIGKLNEYERELRSVCANTPLLEYHQLDLFQWPAMEHCSPGHDQLLASQLAQLGSQLNEWLLILKFPAKYWKDKLIRLEACKIFWQKKTDWGETRRRWLGNYLTSASHCRQHIAFGDFFRKNASTIVEVHFASYLVKTSMHNVEQVRAIVMTSTQLYKVDLDDLSYSLWLPIQDVFSVSVSPDADQLVVLHRKPHAHSSDLFFSFYSCKEVPPLSSHPSQTASSKVGEFVALLSRQYQSITESTLKVNFSSQIHFHLCGLQHTVEVVTRGHASEHLYGHFSARLFRFFTWKRLHRLYLRMTPTALSSTTNSAYELLNKRVDFEMLDKGSFVLIYKK